MNLRDLTLSQWESLASIISDSVTVLAVLVGAAWAVVHFWRRRDLRAKIDLTVSVEFLGVHGSDRDILVQVVVGLSNCGAVRHFVKDLSYSLRTLRVGDQLVSGGDKLLGQIDFPHADVSKRPLFPRRWIDSFVDAGVTNSYRSITKLPAETAFVLASARFSYEDKADAFHNAQCVFAVPEQFDLPLSRVGIRGHQRAAHPLSLSQLQFGLLSTARASISALFTFLDGLFGQFCKFQAQLPCARR